MLSLQANTSQRKRNMSSAAVSEMDDSVSAAVVFMPPAKLPEVMQSRRSHTGSG